jgi:hypothetical protein
MFYRIVLQGQVQPGVALDDVKRQFAKVTGLPESVTEQLFGAAPTVIKRQVAQADAERISLTLRAIGAVVTVEPVFNTPAPVGLDPVTVPGLPMAAGIELPPAPAPEPEAATPKRQPRTRAAKAVLAALVAIGAMVAAYQYEEWINAARRVPAKSPAAPAPSMAGDAVPEAPAIKPAHIIGPWRCTDQATGASTYWEFGESGALLYYGDDLAHGDKPIAIPGLPVGWTLDGKRLTLRFEAAPPRPLTLDRLTLSQLEYRDTRGEDIRCRRP